MNAEWMIRFVQITYLYLLLPVVLIGALARRYLIKPILYKYPLANVLARRSLGSYRYKQYSIYLLRLASLILLACLIARPQWVDIKSRIKSEGIDIVLVLDVSASMQNPDFGDARTRIDVAKSEAVRFVQKRINDAIGLVLFANDAVSRVPLTLDKLMLTDVIQHIVIGDIDANGTKLSVGMLAAVNRLKQSTSKSKIMVVLTDGLPSVDDLDPIVAIEAAKKYGIKIYTVGIGGSDGIKIHQDFWGRQLVTGVDKGSLQRIAQATGGQCFMVTDSSGMREMYDTIDRLETSELDVPIFSRLYELYQPYTMIVLCLIVLELMLSSLLWFSL